MCAVSLVCYLNLWRTLTGVKYYAMVIKKWRMNDEVILISAPWCVCAVGTSVSANLAPVVQRDCPWPERGSLIIAGRLKWPSVQITRSLPAQSELFSGLAGRHWGFGSGRPPGACLTPG